MTKKNKIGELLGNKINEVWTFSTMYDNGCFGVRDKNGKEYRINVLNLLPIMKRLHYKTELARKHTYLSVSCMDYNFNCKECPHRYKCLTENK